MLSGAIHASCGEVLCCPLVSRGSADFAKPRIVVGSEAADQGPATLVCLKREDLFAGAIIIVEILQVSFRCPCAAVEQPFGAHSINQTSD